jgi:hypothetical protein
MRIAGKCVAVECRAATLYYLGMSIRRFEAYPENAQGPFYVEKDMCIICGAPESVAPDLIGFHEDPSGTDAESHCYFKKQPQTPEEIDRAVKAVRANCCGCYWYAGSDPEVKKKLRNAGCGSAIEE